jgi:SpoVK/Ycf46/Vps4 family AAA+-type ATPase
MARSDLIKRLLHSYSRGDDSAFRSAASEIIEDERRKQHTVLARELEALLNAGRNGPGAHSPLTLRPLPKARDDRPLLRALKPDHALLDLVLDETVSGTLEEIIHETRSATLLASYSLQPRQRLLFVGAPGTGKSASAHAVASELSLPVAVANLAAITSSYLGDTARNLEAIIGFAEAQPCVLLLDEFDTLAKERSDRDDHGELKRVVATVLQLLEEFRGESVLIATSNHPQLLDEAVWRRFDDVIAFEAPTHRQIQELLKLKLRAVDHRLPLVRLAKALAGTTQADIERICFAAIRRMVLAGEHVLTESQFDGGWEQIRLRRQAQDHLFTRRLSDPRAPAPKRRTT